MGDNHGLLCCGIPIVISVEMQFFRKRPSFLQSFINMVWSIYIQKARHLTLGTETGGIWVASWVLSLQKSQHSGYDNGCCGPLEEQH